MLKDSTQAKPDEEHTTSERSACYDYMDIYIYSTKVYKSAKPFEISKLGLHV